MIKMDGYSQGVGDVAQLAEGLLNPSAAFCWAWWRVPVTSANVV